MVASGEEEQLPTEYRQSEISSRDAPTGFDHVRRDFDEARRVQDVLETVVETAASIIPDASFSVARIDEETGRVEWDDDPNPPISLWSTVQAAVEKSTRHGTIELVGDTESERAPAADSDVASAPATIVSLPLGRTAVVVGIAERGTAVETRDRQLLDILARDGTTALERLEPGRPVRMKAVPGDSTGSVSGSTGSAGESTRPTSDSTGSVAMLAHDLRNPLNVARGYLELTLDNHDDRRLAEVVVALDRLESLIDHALTADAEEDVEAVTSLELSEVALDAWRNVETTDGELVIADSLSSVRAEPNGLHRVFENLFRNAVEHGKDAPTVAVGSLDGRCGFFVEDDGPGIPDAVRETLFEPGATTETDGTGLGLHIVERIVNAHGWSIDATESPAGGARFEITTDESTAE